MWKSRDFRCERQRKRSGVNNIVETVEKSRFYWDIERSCTIDRSAIILHFDSRLNLISREDSLSWKTR